MVKQNTQGNRASQSSASAASSPTASPRPSTDARPSLDVDSGRQSPAVDAEEAPKGSTQPDEATSTVPETTRTSNESGRSSRAGDSTANGVTEGSEDMERGTNESTNPENNGASKETTQTTSESLPEPPQGSDDAGASTTDKTAESNRQDEVHEYIERIDALQSKLKYLAKDAAESAKNAAVSAEPGSVERQLREKDEKIALLLEEGQKLSKSEMDHRTAIKKLRQQLVENSKSQTVAKKKTDKLEGDLASSEARAQRAEAAENRANESLASYAKASRDMEAVSSERNALNETIQEMKAQLARAVARAETAESKAQSDALEQEKRRTAQLEEELANAKTEHDLNEEKLNRDNADLKEKIDQEKGRARMLEAELKGEQSVLESKMESLRSKAEEASSGAAGESQAKLLRQIETLQTQYSVASENWQTLEGSLLSRLANLEKERDDIAQREGEMRRKIREVVSIVFLVSRGYMLIMFTDRTSKRRKQRKSSRTPKKMSKIWKANSKSASKICRSWSKSSTKLPMIWPRCKKTLSSKRRHARRHGHKNSKMNAQDGENKLSLLYHPSHPNPGMNHPWHSAANR